MPGQGSPFPLLKFQMAPRLKLLIFCRSQKKSPDMYVWVKPRLHTHTECGLRFHPLLHISYIRDYWSLSLSEDVFLKILCPVRRPVTTPDCVLLKDKKCFVRFNLNFLAMIWFQCTVIYRRRNRSQSGRSIELCAERVGGLRLATDNSYVYDVSWTLKFCSPHF